MIRIRIIDDQPLNEVAEALYRTAEKIENGERPEQIRDRQGNTVGFVEMDLREATETEETVTFIAGVLHHWTGFPGTWEPFKPETGQLMRVRR